MKKLKMLAIDLGASSGRGIIGSFDGNKIELARLAIISAARYKINI